jgi:hypothetical protein
VNIAKLLQPKSTNNKLKRCTKQGVNSCQEELKLNAQHKSEKRVVHATKEAAKRTVCRTKGTAATLMHPPVAHSLCVRRGYVVWKAKGRAEVNTEQTPLTCGTHHGWVSPKTRGTTDCESGRGLFLQLALWRWIKTHDQSLVQRL